MPSSHLILCRPLLLLPPIPPSIRVFSNESTLRMRWPRTGVSALASVLPKKSQSSSPSEWTGWISLQSKGLSRVFSNTTVQKHQFFGAQPSSQSNLSHPYMTTGKTIALTRQTFAGEVMSLLFNMLSRLVITFLLSGKQRTDYYIVKYGHRIFHLQLLQNIGYISHIKIINSPQNNIYNFCRDNAPHPSTLAWRIPWTEEPGRLQAMGSLRVRHD